MLTLFMTHSFLKQFIRIWWQENPGRKGFTICLLNTCCWVFKVFHYQPSITIKWLKYCGKWLKIHLEIPDHIESVKPAVYLAFMHFWIIQNCVYMSNLVDCTCWNDQNLWCMSYNVNKTLFSAMTHPKNQHAKIRRCS